MTNDLSKRLVMCEKCAHNKGDTCAVSGGPRALPCLCAAYHEDKSKEHVDKKSEQPIYGLPPSVFKKNEDGTISVVGSESSNPDHYKFGDIECVDAMRACSTKEEFRAHLKLVIMKYLWRLGRKDDPKIEAEKIKVYAGWLVDNENDDPLRKQK